MSEEINFNFFNNILVIIKNWKFLLITIIITFIFFFTLLNTVDYNHNKKIIPEKYPVLTVTNPDFISNDYNYYNKIILNQFNELDEYVLSKITYPLTSKVKFNTKNTFFEFIIKSLDFEYFIEDKIINNLNIKDKKTKNNYLKDFLKIKNIFTFEYESIDEEYSKLNIFSSQTKTENKNIEILINFLYLIESIYISLVEEELFSIYDYHVIPIKNELIKNLIELNNQYTENLEKNKIVKNLNIEETNINIENEYRKFESKIILENINKITNTIKYLNNIKQIKISKKFLFFKIHNLEIKVVQKEKHNFFYNVNYNTVLLSFILSLALSIIILFTRENFKRFNIKIP